MLSPAQSIAIYTGCTILTYIETSGFENNHRILLSFPMIILALLTLTTTMNPKVKFTTAMSFLMSAFAMYFQSFSRTTGILSSIIHTMANGMYFLSYREIARKTSSPIILLAVCASYGPFFHLLQDLVVAIPSLVIILTILLASHILVMSTAASLCRYGQHGDFDAKQASFVRLFGAIIGWLSTFLFIYNSFQTHTKFLNTVSRVLFYLSNSMLFISNERAF